MATDSNIEECKNYTGWLLFVYRPQVCPRLARTLAQMEKSITEYDWSFPHHPFPNAKFQPITV